MPRTQKTWDPRPGIVFQPETGAAMARGIDALVAAIRPTLGPLPRLVAHDQRVLGRRPELLDSGGLIARRMTQLPERSADAGAMLLRHTLWGLHQDVGDGTATCAVIFQAVYRGGRAYLAAGGCAMGLRCGLERALGLALAELDRMARPVTGQAQLARIAEAVCHEGDLAELLGEIFAIIGAEGRLEIREARGLELECSFVTGRYWDGGLHSPSFADDQARGRAELIQPAVLLSDLEIDEPQALIPLLDAAATAGVSSLLLVARRVGERALGLLLHPRNRERLRVVAVQTPGLGDDVRAAALEDLAVLTGARPLLGTAGDRLERATAADLGQVRRAWADRHSVGFEGVGGEPRALRRHVDELRAALMRSRDTLARERLTLRIGRLLGGSATLGVGGVTPAAIEARRASAERSAATLRAALRDGVLPGGGVALLNCRAALLAEHGGESGSDERAAQGILAAALAAPIDALLTNAGADTPTVLADLAAAGHGYGYDLVSEQVVEMSAAGILDPTGVTRAALERAVSASALALTTDVIVQRRNPPPESNP